MERLRERLALAQQALERLDELLPGDSSDTVKRDAAIQRFEFSFEACWKAAQRFLLLIEGIPTASPKAVLRACHDAQLLNADSTSAALEMADDRNLTVHTYNEALALEIFARLPAHRRLMGELVGAMTGRLSAGD